MSSTITTKSRKLEQFFYAHGVDWTGSFVDDEGMWNWVYPDNDENRRIMEEFKVAIARREVKKGV